MNILASTVKDKGIEMFMEWAKPHVLAHHIRRLAKQDAGLAEALRECLISDFNDSDREQSMRLIRGYSPVWQALAENPEWADREVMKLIKYLKKIK